MVLNEVRTAIAEEIAKVTREMDAPVAPFGYGTDLSCVDDLTETMSMVDQGTTQGIAEALVRRLTTPRGGLPDDADYGRDIRSMVNRGATTLELRALAAVIHAEATKDDRIDTLRVTFTPSEDGSEIDLELVVTPVDATIGVFSLVLALTSAELLIKAMAAPA